MSTLMYSLSFQKAQKEVDALVEFRQLYLAHVRAVNVIDCICNVAPDVMINVEILAELRQHQERMRKIVVEDNGTGLGFESQKAIIISTINMLSLADTVIGSTMATVTEPQFNAIKERCRIGGSG